MTSIPETIPFSSVSLGERARTVYSGIEELDEAIEDVGLIQPLVLVLIVDEFEAANGIPRYEVDAGGRRWTALKRQFERGVWDGVLHHATTSTPGRPGFVLKGADEATPLKRALTELNENLNREDFHWTDQMRLIVKTFRLAKRTDDLAGESKTMKAYGSMLGVTFSNLQCAEMIHDDVIANPERYKDVSSLRAAYPVFLKAVADDVAKIASERSARLVRNVKKVEAALDNSIQNESESFEEVVHIELVDKVFYGNGLDILASHNQFDHIITDPDYGVSVEALESNMGGAAIGVAQESIQQTLWELNKFITASFHALKEQGFLVFFYDLDHHEKLQAIAKSVGFRVQRWPIVWHKTDARSNAAPTHNFTKNIEYAMVCRKPGATLQTHQPSSIFACDSGRVVKELNHPFAKPYELWKFIFNAVTIPGQTICDPFAGSGSCPIAAIQQGLIPVACEVQEPHFHSLVSNLKSAYRKLHGPNTTFDL